VRGLPAERSESNTWVDNMKQEYDFSKGVRGKYFKRYQAGSNVVILDPEIAAVFKDSEAVNDALRARIRAAGHNKTLLRTRKARRRA
jgi:hypothetical protein